MKAIQFSRYGGPEVIEVAEAAKPTPGPGQVLVAVRGAAINPFDNKLRSGALKDKLSLNFPFTLGGDFAGIIEMVGEGVKDYKIGDEVYGSAMVLGGGSGSLAEFAVANAQGIAHKPANTNFIHAASIVLTGLSAIEAIDKLELKRGQTLLIHGGAGGIGSAAIQYAKHLELKVLSTARGADVEFVSGLGADEVINYEATDFTEKLKALDGVFDTVGGETYQKSFAVLKPGGKIVSMNMPPDKDLFKKYNVTALFQNTKVTTSGLQRLAQLLEKLVIIPQVDQAFPLELAAEAYTYIEFGHPKGKVVIEINN